MMRGSSRHPIQDVSCNSPKSLRDNAKRMHPTSPIALRIVVIVLLVGGLFGGLVLKEHLRDEPDRPALVEANSQGS